MIGMHVNGLNSVSLYPSCAYVLEISFVNSYLCPDLSANSQAYRNGGLIISPMQTYTELV